MDDSIVSVLTDEQGIDLYQQLSRIWEKVGMHTHKWLSNSPVVLNKIPPEDRVYKINLDDNKLPAIKTLGIIWLAEEDVFSFELQVIERKFEPTKHNFLKKIATLFYSLGFLSSFMIRAKIMMQDIWIHGLDWDDPLPKEISTKIVLWFAELVLLPEILKFQDVYNSRSK